MRLLIVSTVPSTLRAFLLPYAVHFRQRGWDVDAATGPGLLGEEVTAAFDHVHELPWARCLTHLDLVTAARDIRRLLPAYDLVHTHTPIASFVTRLAALSLPRRRRPVVVYTAHGFHFHPGGRPATNAVFTAAEWLAGRGTDRLVVLTETDLRSARRRHLVPVGRSTLLPGVGLDLAHYAPHPHLLARAPAVRRQLGIPQDAPLFTMVAAMDPGKNHGTAVRALALVPSAHLVCAGSGPQRDAIVALATELDVLARLHLVGSLADIRELVLASTATVLPSRREGLSRAVLESLALGRPVLGARVRGIADLVPPEAGTLFEPDDVQALAQAMRDAAAFPPPAQLRAQLEAHLQTYALDRILALHDDLYGEALERSTVRG